jgi:very-short-patch-repair endonuclease
VVKKHPLAGAYARARALRREMTDAERKVWRMLRLHQVDGQKFRRQVPIGRYIADFICHDARLIIEIDGSQHDAALPDEAERTRFLEREGYRVLRFWNNEVLTNLEGVYDVIAAALSKPSPSMGEGREGVTSDAAPPSGITPTHTLPHRGGGLPSDG